MLYYSYYSLFFFFQAEDGIRYYKVTGVQTCALPILRPSACYPALCSTTLSHPPASAVRPRPLLTLAIVRPAPEMAARIFQTCPTHWKIGRASCRERV